VLVFCGATSARDAGPSRKDLVRRHRSRAAGEAKVSRYGERRASSLACKSRRTFGEKPDIFFFVRLWVFFTDDHHAAVSIAPSQGELTEAGIAGAGLAEVRAGPAAGDSADAAFA